MRSKKSSKMGYYILTVLILLAVIFPFLCEIFASFKSSKDSSKAFNLIPNKFTNYSYKNLFDNKDFGKYMLNSFAVAGITTLVALIIGFFAAYAIARYDFKGKKLVVGFLIIMLMIPEISIIAPIYKFMKDSGMQNNYLGLIIPYLSFAIPLAILILTVFLRRIPFGLEEAATLEGASFLNILNKIIIPLAVPGIVIAAVAVFIVSWSECMFALAINTKDKCKTAVAFVSSSVAQNQLSWAEASVAVILIALPVVILMFLFLRKYMNYETE